MKADDFIETLATFIEKNCGATTVATVIQGIFNGMAHDNSNNKMEQANTRPTYLSLFRLNTKRKMHLQDHMKLTSWISVAQTTPKIRMKSGEKNYLHEFYVNPIPQCARKSALTRARVFSRTKCLFVTLPLTINIHLLSVCIK